MEELSVQHANDAMRGCAAPGDLGVLARRKIEAAIVDGAEMARRASGAADLQSFKAILPLWTKDDALTIEVVDDRPGVFDFNVTRRRYAETYRAMGLGDIGGILSCSRDGAFCEGYDSRIELKRTQTIMGGATHCDFRYRVKARGETRRLKGEE